MVFIRENSPGARAEYAGFRIITLPKDDAELRQALRAKLEEYGRRLERISNPDPSKTTYGNEQHIDLMYKRVLLAQLLGQGEINTDEIKHELIGKIGGVHEAIFDSAVGVISDYVRTGGQNLLYGTGLKK